MSTSSTITQKPTTAKSITNCMDFSQSQIPDLKDMDHYMFVEYDGQGHLHPQRVASARFRNVASVKMTYISADHMSYLKQSSENLNLLDLSGSNLFKIPLVLISGMAHLQIIILDNNQLSDNSFCKEFSNILGKSLKEISLCNNNLTSMLTNLDNFVKLVRLKMSTNQITTLKGIDKLKKLRLLRLEFNDIAQLGSGFYVTKRLENVYLSNNKLTTISIAIRNLVYLRELDLSNNAIKIIPGDLFLLPKLESLKLNNNKLCQLPKFKITSRLHNPISFVDLSFNNIVRFPEEVMRVTNELDLSNNKIKVVPSSILKKISYHSTQKLYLNNNPIMDPPKEICDSGLKVMIQYYEEYEGTEVKYQGIKVCCYGNDGLEKNKIVNILTDQGDDIDNQGLTIDILETYETTSKSLNNLSNSTQSFNIKCVNMSGEINHFNLLIFFQTSPSLNIIFVDVDSWTEDLFDISIGCWLKYFLSKHNEAVFSIVCVTKLTTDDATQTKCDRIKSLVDSLFTDYLDRIVEEIRRIESQNKITAAMSQSLKKFIQLKSLKEGFDHSPVSVNLQDPKSIKRLMVDILKMMTDKRIFPNVANPVPSFWSDVQTYIEDECYNFPIISFKEFEVLLQQRFNLKPAAKQIAKYLHEIGCVIWCEDSLPTLNQWIITSPTMLVECCRALFRTDLKSYLEDPNDTDKNMKRFKKKFPHSRFGYQRSCEILVNDAILLPELVSILFEDILPAQSVLKMLFYLCQCWNLGYIIEYPGFLCQDWSAINGEVADNYSDITSSATSQEYRAKSAESRQSSASKRSQEPKNVPMPPIFLTLLVDKNMCSTKALEQWNIDCNLKISICYRFPIGYPKLIFHQATVRANDSAKFNVSMIDHWKDGFQGQIKDEPIVFRIQRSQAENDDNVIRYKFLHRESESDGGMNDDSKASDLWKWIQPILIDMDELLNSYQGLWFERFIECPNCNELSYPGTWHSYNDNSEAQSEPCQWCSNIAPIYLLEPPKISKNISAEEVIRNIRRQFQRE